MAGLGLFDQKSALAVAMRHAHRHRLQILHWTQRKWAPESPTDSRKKLSFGIF
jgi:hypothetical protein